MIRLVCVECLNNRPPYPAYRVSDERTALDHTFFEGSLYCSEHLPNIGRPRAKVRIKK